MSKKAVSVTPGPWKRPEPATTRPNRSFGGYYRSADRKIKGKDLRGVPLQTAEDAAVAAVRIGYSVIDAQIERGLNMARRLRGAADRAGVVDTSEAIGLAESLLNRGALIGLELLESAAGQSGSPIKRLVTAQYRLLGSLLGLQSGAAAPEGEDRHRTSKPAAPGHDAARRPSPAPSRRPVRIRHLEGSTKRAVTVILVEFAAPLQPSARPRELRFHSMSGASEQCIDAVITTPSNAPPVLEITTTDLQPAGRWRAAICEPDGEQVGIMEIEL